MAIWHLMHWWECKLLQPLWKTLAVPSKVRHPHTLWLSGSTLREMKMHFHKKTYAKCSYCTIQNSPQLENTHMPAHQWLNRCLSTLWYPHTVKYYRAMRTNDLHVHAKTHMNLATAMWTKANPKEYILCYSIYINTKTGKAHRFLEVI